MENIARPIRVKLKKKGNKKNFKTALSIKFHYFDKYNAMDYGFFIIIG